MEKQKERRPKCKQGRVCPWRFLSLIACVFLNKRRRLVAPFHLSRATYIVDYTAQV
jgi:hypothetical protein